MIKLLATACTAAVLALAPFADASAHGTKSSGGLELPKLDVSWNCGSCKSNDKVPPLIVAAYEAAAAKDGNAVSTTDTAALAITDFRQRATGARVMLGLFAGRDRLAVSTTWHGATVKAEDAQGNSIEGMNHLCAAVGRKLYVAMLAKARTAD